MIRGASGKYKNNPFYYDSLTGRTFPPKTKFIGEQKERVSYWDSELEFRVWCKLHKLFPLARIHRQHELLILPKNETFPKLTWNIDFVVSTSDRTYFIEVKGQWILHDKGQLNDFCKLLRIIQLFQPEIFNNLSIISDASWKLGTSSLHTIDIDSFGGIA